jgi:hypothetical protein
MKYPPAFAATGGKTAYIYPLRLRPLIFQQSGAFIFVG